MLGVVWDDRNAYVAGTSTGALGPSESRLLIASLTQQLAPDCSFMVEAEWLAGEWLEGIAAGETTPARAQWDDYTSRIVRVMLDVEF